MSAKSLMIQGTGSSAGKSVLVTALCRIFARRGLSVAPFKSQNMSLNSFVTAGGGEIGRAQAVQAEAAGIEPLPAMNPVLLKPCGEKRSQVIVNGAARETLTAQEYYGYRARLKDEVLASYESLARQYDLLILEGAGSPAEINLRENDLANMGMAEMAGAPVLLVGDIDRGGVFAALYGTIKLLEPDEQRRVRGLIINKFRGDAAILEPGLRQLEYILGRPFVGVLPYWDIHIDEEDSLAERLGRRGPSGIAPEAQAPELDIALIRLPRLSNFTDFAPLDAMPDAQARWVSGPGDLGRPDLLILPGSKNSLQDMLFLHDCGLARAITALHARGTPVIGICGGYQMLGRVIRDPEGLEGGPGEVPGLGLLDAETRFEARKRTAQSSLRISPEAARGLLRGCRGMTLSGYEIHMGRTELSGGIPLGGFDDGAPGGAVNAGGTVMGGYLHGLFDNLIFTRTLLNTLREDKGLPPLPPPARSQASFRQSEYDRLADLVEAHLDMPALEQIIGL